jgi:dTDP-4-amino-4,6-dideoxygalactose transaminase
MEHKVRYVNYQLQFRNQEKEIMDTVYDVLSNGDLMMRQQMRDFEENLAAFVGTKYAIGVSNCTDGLYLTYRALGIGPGDEVISVSHTFVATIAAIHHTGATPILVDIDDDHNIDASKIEAAITPRTKAIVPVHLNGRVSDMPTILEIAKKHNLIVIEDSAQGLGGSIDGKKGGSWGVAACFSFYPAKLLGAYGDAGAITTNDEELANRLRRLRDHGRAPNGIAEWSFNCRLDNLQAALLDLKLKSLPQWLERRRELAAIYQAELGDVKELRLPPAPEVNGRRYDVYQNYEIEAEDREGLTAHLKAEGVEHMLPWGGKGVHQFEALELGHFSLPRTEKLFQGALMLPMFPELTDEEVRYVAQVVRQFYAAKAASVPQQKAA